MFAGELDDLLPVKFLLISDVLSIDGRIALAWLSDSIYV